MVRECDNLVFKFTVSGRFRRMYTVKVECFPAGAGGESALSLSTPCNIEFL